MPAEAEPCADRSSDQESPDRTPRSPRSSCRPRTTAESACLAAFGLPLWTTLPELSNSTAESSNAFTASIYRLYGLLPYARIEEKGLTLGLTSARHGEGVTFIIEQLRRLLEENGVRVRVGGEPAQPGEVVLLDAPALLDSREAFIALRRADLIALVVEAQKSTVPVVEHALTILTTAFGKVDGIIINRRRFEVPSKVLQTIARYRSAF